MRVGVKDERVDAQRACDPFSSWRRGFFWRVTVVATRRLVLTFPPHLIKEPLIYRVAKECELVPNIRKARVTDTTGEVILDLQGPEENLERGIAYLTDRGITVTEVRENR
jgi:hypothetical protein